MKRRALLAGFIGLPLMGLPRKEPKRAPAPEPKHEPPHGRPMLAGDASGWITIHVDGRPVYLPVWS